MSKVLHYFENDMTINLFLLINDILELNIIFKTLKPIDLKSSKFKRLNPKTFPILELESGALVQGLFNIITLLTNNSELYNSASAIDRAKSEQYIYQIQNEIHTECYTLSLFLYGLIEKDKKTIAECQSNFFKSLKLFNKILENKNFLSGKETAMVEDLYLFIILRPIFKFVITENKLKPFNNILKWFATIANNQKVLKTLGKSQINKSNKSLL